jgi:hypothetical protein
VAQRGRYLVVVVSGCNDCHTPGYLQHGGPKVPEKEWLTGVPVGYQGPWGTSYASNLRLVLNAMSGSTMARSTHGKERLPPMPWFNLREMTDDDLKADLCLRPQPRSRRCRLRTGVCRAGRQGQRRPISCSCRRWTSSRLRAR